MGLGYPKVTVGNQPSSIAKIINTGAVQPQWCTKNELVARRYLSGPQIFFIHYNGFPVVGGEVFDLLFQLPFPCNVFLIVSDNTLTDNVFISLKPTGRIRSGSAGITVHGNEEWFPMTDLSGIGTGNSYSSVLRFGMTINQFYLSYGTGAGSGPVLTIACANDPNFYLQGGFAGT